MSKITFRADDDLVKRLETLDASKSEVMREALRDYLDGHSESTEQNDGTLDAVVAERVDDLIDQRLGPRGSENARDINVNVTVEGSNVRASEGNSVASTTDERPRHTTADTSQAGNTCGQCGESLDSGHVYCPNCGEKAAHRVFCDCGDELRSDWAFCPGCGRRTPSADVLDSA
ncbi:double zinc ribbon domain-containing protein [Haladaptatus caseinilyticus]|uniref:double zinc ribbon domain-containing protein n=1 Tax=Haladaptatus caseinilyticus TaxID=2993314 RepID=UPI00224AA846|nr:zinc ribbon domain-containing protein [Haladaptatus caseinilyticus]